jgi:hypothetical protein
MGRFTLNKRLAGGLARRVGLAIRPVFAAGKPAG